MKITIQFYSNWAIGSGKGGSSQDSIILKDDNGLPFIPGKTLKGLIRDAFIECNISENDTERLFGQKKTNKENNEPKKLKAGSLRFNSAYLHNEFSKLSKEQISHLFTSKTSTRLEENKQAKEHSLRKNEVCIPLSLTATIVNKDDNSELSETDYEKVEKALKMLKILGEKRHRGLGRCKIIAPKYLLKNQEEKTQNSNADNGSKIIKNSIRFKCTVTEPLVLVKKAKTGQNIESLDYIPGNTFRGIVAGEIASGNSKKFDDIVFNNTVQFGDAHLLINDKRSLKAPFSFFYDKSKDDNTLYNFHHLDDKDWTDKKLKSQKDGYLINTNEGIEIKKINYGNRMKSSRNLELRSSEDGGLFSYHYLKKGQEFEFEVNSSKPSYLKEIKKILNGKTKYFGKSKSAEFGGAIKIDNRGEKELEYPISNGKYLYAVSNLCFLNEYGEFTSKPSLENLGIKGEGKIDWEKSQVKFRTYAPYNFHRKNHDFERLIIEKGSVFVFESEVVFDEEKIEDGIGCFLTEGYGKVLVNPYFLKEKEVPLKPKAEPKPEEEVKKQKQKVLEEIKIGEHDTVEIKFIKSKYIKDLKEITIDDLVDEILNKKFEQQNSSQWARVFNATTRANSYGELQNLLWTVKKETTENNNYKIRDKAIFTGGLNTWKEADIEKIKKFLNDNQNNEIWALRKLAKKMIQKT